MQASSRGSYVIKPPIRRTRRKWRTAGWRLLNDVNVSVMTVADLSKVCPAPACPSATLAWMWGQQAHIALTAYPDLAWKAVCNTWVRR